MILHVDGGARGNPGPAGAGVVLHTSERVPVLEAGYWLGTMTNNQAEYRALILGLTAAHQAGARHVTAYGDSELVVRQIHGQYKVKAGPLQELHAEAKQLFTALEGWEFHHVRREANRRADELVNLALDCGEDIIEIDARGSAPAPQPAASGPPTVELTVLTAGARDACPAVMPAGAVLAVGERLPEGLCLHAAASLLGAIIDLQAAGRGSSEVGCGKKGCGARFALMVRD